MLLSFGVNGACRLDRTVKRHTLGAQRFKEKKNASNHMLQQQCTRPSTGVKITRKEKQPGAVFVAYWKVYFASVVRPKKKIGVYESHLNFADEWNTRQEKNVSKKERCSQSARRTFCSWPQTCFCSWYQSFDMWPCSVEIAFISGTCIGYISCDLSESNRRGHPQKFDVFPWKVY